MVSSIVNDGILTGTTTPDQGEPESNGYKEILHIPQRFRTEASSSNGVCHIQNNLSRVLLLC